jgi:uncharacterized protein YcbK (DUF882 family)
MLRLGFALLLVIGVGGGAYGANSSGGAAAAEADDDAVEAERPEAPLPEARSKASGGGAKAARAKGKAARRSKGRRGGHKVVGHVVPDEKLRAEAPPRPSGDLHLFGVSTREEVKVNIYNEDGSYNVEALAAVSHLLRCKRTDTQREIDARLLVVLSHVYDHYGKKRIEVVSGYRNQRRTSSFHYQGSASDIRIPGVPPKQLRAYVETLDAGGMGIGLYPRSKFVHVDVRPPPSYRWIDWSPPEPNAPGKRPPKGFVRKKKLQS